MRIEVWSIMLLINLSTDASCAEVHFKVEKNFTPIMQCNLIVASQIRIDRGTEKQISTPKSLIPDIVSQKEEARIVHLEVICSYFLGLSVI